MGSAPIETEKTSESRSEKTSEEVGLPLRSFIHSTVLKWMSGATLLLVVGLEGAAEVYEHIGTTHMRDEIHELSQIAYQSRLTDIDRRMDELDRRLEHVSHENGHGYHVDATSPRISGCFCVPRTERETPALYCPSTSRGACDLDAIAQCEHKHPGFECASPPALAE